MVGGDQASAARRRAFADQRDAEDAQHLDRPPADAFVPCVRIEARKCEQHDRQAMQAVDHGTGQAQNRTRAPFHDTPRPAPQCGLPRTAVTAQSAAS